MALLKHEMKKGKKTRRQVIGGGVIYVGALRCQIGANGARKRERQT